MSALIRKELRLMLPAWLAAVGLCVLPFVIGAFVYDQQRLQTHVGFALFTVPISCAFLGLSTFGREFAAGAFQLLLAQPRSRREFWSVKLIVLGFTVASVLLVVLATCVPFYPWRDSLGVLGTSAVSGLAVASGALWLTLLLRQLLAAFWISILVPLGLVLSMSSIPNTTLREWLMGTVLLLYAVVSFLIARKLFLTSQDVAWTGGTVTVPTLRKASACGVMNAGRKSHPVLAQLRKEFQFQQVAILLAVLLFVANLGVLLCERLIKVGRSNMWELFFEGFWFLWFLMPMMIGCAAVAEERRLGTLEAQLCLPMSRAKQFLIKLSSVVALALGMGALPIFILHWIGKIIGLTEKGSLGDPDAVYVIPMVCACISLLTFYASSLSRHFLQAFATTIGCALAVVVLGNLLTQPPTISGYTLWNGPIGILAAGALMLVFAFRLVSWRGAWRLALALVVASLLFVVGEIVLRGKSLALTLPSQAGWWLVLTGYCLVAGMILLPLVLAFRNYRHVQSDAGLWTKNLCVWFGVLMLTAVFATAGYNRVWEFSMQFEPPAGPARLSGNVRPMIAKYFRSGWLLALLPDGRLWAMREYETTPASGEWTGGENEIWQSKQVKNPRAEFIGSNWVCMAMSLYDGAGVRSDGSLWRISWWETAGTNGVSVPVGVGNWHQKGRNIQQTPVKATRIGSDSDWVMTAAGGSHFLALKRDGTLWGWGDNRVGQLGSGLPDKVERPAQIGAESDWEFVAAFASGSAAVKRDRSIWKWGQAYPITSHGIGKGFIGGTPQKIATLPARVSRIVSTHFNDVFVCEDGSGWGVGQLGLNYLGSGYSSVIMTEPQKLWDDGRWTDIKGETSQLVAGLRADGSLWRQGADRNDIRWATDPERIGDRKDWIAVRNYDDTIYALGKDGTLCRFGEEAYHAPELTCPTRRVTWSVNVLDSVKP